MSSFFDKLLKRFDNWLHDRRVAAIRRSFAECGSDFSLDLPSTIRGAEHVRVGARVSINAFVHIWGQGGITIGDDCLIASHAALTTLTHDLASARYRDTVLTKPISIGRNVWIGTHAVIMPGIVIGDGAVIGAGAVVTSDVPPHTVVTGVPAKAIRTLPSGKEA